MNSCKMLCLMLAAIAVLSGCSGRSVYDRLDNAYDEGYSIVLTPESSNKWSTIWQDTSKKKPSSILSWSIGEGYYASTVHPGKLQADYAFSGKNWIALPEAGKNYKGVFQVKVIKTPELEERSYQEYVSYKEPKKSSNGSTEYGRFETRYETVEIPSWYEYTCDFAKAASGLGRHHRSRTGHASFSPHNCGNRI